MAEKAKTRKKRITRGPRKGQVIEVYVKSGTEVRRDVATGKTGTNRQKGSARAGRKYTEAIDAKGRSVHIYKDPKTGRERRVVLKGKRNAAVRSTKATRYEDGSRGLTVAQRQAAVKKKRKDR